MAKQQQGGFTLIELMIVVAIIGILAAVALPAYQDYVARAQASEAVSLSTGAKTAIAEYYQTNGSYPGTATSLAVSDLAATGTYSTLAVTEDTGVIVVTMGSATGAMKDKKFTFSPVTTNNAFKWTCTSDADANLLPKGCTKA
ncbi:pilin [Pseudoalteromonas sp. JBTF-M23]|uniref:Pilin n=1 Tax=Pseudoalteromonas caenipelagi TaxID=2726988 RepID=A0A849VIE3_9GAMM|nr:pilin [Pseudoalteromonas caenipelagi]NOU51604.1 pilin [Pseudoalteromonas caenipelagi]